MKVWTTPWGQLRLGREPYDSDPALQAWSAADAILAQEFFQQAPNRDRPVWVFNDAFGALATLLVANGYQVVQVSDSALSQRSTLWNLEENRLDDGNLTLLDSLSPLPPIAPNGAPTILYRLPRSLALLEYQLWQLAAHLPQGAEVLGSGMAKEIHSSTLQVFENRLGPTTTSLAQQKARTIRSLRSEIRQSQSGYPGRWTLGPMNWTLVNHASVFSRERLDPGTRLLLRHFPKLSDNQATIIDLGCGNGILGLAAATKAPKAQIWGVDESFMAVWSARETFRANGLSHRGQFLAGDGLEDFDPETADIVLCNPPFHYQNAQTIHIALGFFQQAQRVLRPSGELWVVANRHLGYHKALGELFASVQTVGTDDRFIVFRCRR